MWGNNAVDAQSLVIGDKLLIMGRFQSREYTKNIDGETLTLMAYELSASKVKLLENSSLAHF
jgi:single-stranded DNA-binding protein